MTQLQYLPDLLLTVLFGVQASFTHPGILSAEKERLGDSELKGIVKRTQSSTEAREILAFNPRVWTALCETLRAGNAQLAGVYTHDVDHSKKKKDDKGKESHVGCRCHEGGVDAAGVKKDKSYLLPKVWEVVILGRNLLATKERGQDLAAESKFEEEVRKLCEICVRHTEKESYHKVLITCLQFLNNLTSGNEKRKMSLWMQLFVPGSTRLLEAAKRKALRQYQTKVTKDGKNFEEIKKSGWKPEVDLEKLNLDLQAQNTSNGSDNKMSFIALLPTVLTAKEMLPLLLIIHGSITDLEGADPARQLMRCKMMLAAEAGIGLMAGLLMFVDAWHEIEDHIYFELILEIMETILQHGLITYLFETLKEYVDCRNFHFEGIHAITPPQAVVLRLLHTIFAPATLPAFPDPAFVQQFERKMSEKTTPPVNDETDITAKFSAVLDELFKNSSSKWGHNQEDGEEVEMEPPMDPGPEIINFLAVKVLKSQLGPAVRDMVARLGKSKQEKEQLQQQVSSDKGKAPARPKSPSQPNSPSSATHPMTPTDTWYVEGVTIYDVELHYEGLVQLLELLVLFAESSSGRNYLRSTNCVEELILLLQCLDEHIPRTTLKNANRSGQLHQTHGNSSNNNNNNNNQTQGQTEVQGQEQQIQLQQAQGSPDINDPVEFRWPLIKRTIVQLLSLLCYGSVPVQDEIRKHHGVETVLNMCNVDDENPFIREHAILCIRNLLEGNSANQKIVSDLEAKKAIPSDVLEQHGMETFIDKEGKVKVGVKGSNNNNNSNNSNNNNSNSNKKKKGKGK